MSKKKKVIVTTSAPKVEEILEPTKSKINPMSESAKAVTSDLLVFGRNNYMWMLAGVGLMALGFALMSGGKMPSPDVWDADIIYSFRRTVLAPIAILGGLGLQVVAIFVKK